MAVAQQLEAGAVESLWRYPVKSMLGEELQTAALGERGLAGDRAYALLDRADGKVASAKNPRKWPNLFAFRAALVEGSGAKAHSLRITLPGGRVVTGDQGDIDGVLSKAVNRTVALVHSGHGPAAAARPTVAAGWAGRAEQYWADIEGMERRDAVTDFTLPAGTFFDGATVHLITTATLDRLRRLYPEGKFDVRRFRPNIVVKAAGDEDGFVENDWIGRTLTIGDEVRMTITAPCGRCVMTTLPQGGDLPRDIGILRTVVQHNQARVGIYAVVARGGMIRRGARVELSPSEL
jgi:uncharacterized protein YcbX